MGWERVRLDISKVSKLIRPNWMSEGAKDWVCKRVISTSRILRGMGESRVCAEIWYKMIIEDVANI